VFSVGPNNSSAAGFAGASSTQAGSSGAGASGSNLPSNGTKGGGGGGAGGGGDGGERGGEYRDGENGGGESKAEVEGGGYIAGEGAGAVAGVGEGAGLGVGGGEGDGGGGEGVGDGAGCGGVPGDDSSESTYLGSDKEDDVDVPGDDGSVSGQPTLAQLVKEDFTLSQVELLKYSDKTLSQIEELRDAKCAGESGSPIGEAKDDGSHDASRTEGLSNRAESLPKDSTADMLTALLSISTTETPTDSATETPTNVVVLSELAPVPNIPSNMQLEVAPVTNIPSNMQSEEPNDAPDSTTENNPRTASYFPSKDYDPTLEDLKENNPMSVLDSTESLTVNPG